MAFFPAQASYFAQTTAAIQVDQGHRSQSAHGIHPPAGFPAVVVQVELKARRRKP